MKVASVRRDTAMPEHPTEEERRYFDERTHCMKEETGYTWIQGTKPQTLAYGLTDSPAGQLAWITEKFGEWTDNGRPDEAVDRFASVANSAASQLNVKTEDIIAAKEKRAEDSARRLFGHRIRHVARGFQDRLFWIQHLDAILREITNLHVMPDLPCAGLDREHSRQQLEQR
jgi:hypothetical protein